MFRYFQQKCYCDSEQFTIYGSVSITEKICWFVYIVKSVFVMSNDIIT